MKFFIEVEEIYQQTFAVEAEDLEEAMEKIEDAVNDGTIDLNYDSFVSRELNDRTTEIEQYPKDFQDINYLHLTDTGLKSAYEIEEEEEDEE